MAAKQHKGHDTTQKGARDSSSNPQTVYSTIHVHHITYVYMQVYAGIYM